MGRRLEEVLDGSNLRAALKRVVQNQGSPGSDGMRVEELKPYLKEHWPRIREELLSGRYQPLPVKRTEIPKRGGGVRELGIPSVLDRFLQQALLQVLQPRFDPSFSKHSHGFRPGRGAQGAILEAQRYVQEGRHWVVDVDLEKFFDRVNHDVLMERLARRIQDRRVLSLIRRYLEAGVMAHGVVIERHEGTPQGGPLSPLLANVLLDEVDRELEKRGHCFVRYADDLNVYVRTRQAGDRVMEGLKKLFARLRLKVNEKKSAVAPVWERQFLGLSFGRDGKSRIERRLANRSLEAFKDRVRAITSRTAGRSVKQVIAELKSYLGGWLAYFRLVQARRIFRTLDQWIRRRLRMLHLRQWRHGHRKYQAVIALGVARDVAWKVAHYPRMWWRLSKSKAVQIALPNRYFDELGLPRLGT